METVIVSAPGKVILHGEHAVVFGKKAIAASLNLRTYIFLKRTHNGQVSISLPDIGVEKTWAVTELQQRLPLPLCDVSHPAKANDSLLGKLRAAAGLQRDETDTRSLALVAFLYLYCSITPLEGNLPCVQICVQSVLPASAGLGSSAAYSTCLAASCLLLRGSVAVPTTDNGSQRCTPAGWKATELETINSWAYQAERVIHGNPSGIDNSVSTYGGALEFHSGKITPLERMPQLRILLMNTRIPRSTKVLVEGVRQKYNKWPHILSPVLDSIEAISDAARDVFDQMSATGGTAEHYAKLQELISINQSHLEVLGVSHTALRQICDAVTKRGLAAKLTGAGGGGCAFALIPPGTEPELLEGILGELRDELRFDCWETTIGGQGVMYHPTVDGIVTPPPGFV